MMAEKHFNPGPSTWLKSRIVTSVTAILLFTGSPLHAMAGAEVDCNGSLNAYKQDPNMRGYDCRCLNGPRSMPTCTYKNGQSSHGNSGGLSSTNQMKLQIMQSVTDSIANAFIRWINEPASVPTHHQPSPDASAAISLQQEKARQDQEAARFQIERDQMIKSLKQSDGTQGLGFKETSKLDVDFKTQGDDTASLAAHFKKPANDASDKPLQGADIAANATPFFGDTMTVPDLQTLLDPGNDPRVVDMRNAVTYVVENLKNQREQLASRPQAGDVKKSSQPRIQALECKEIENKLNGFIVQRNKFHKTILLTNEQLTTWEDANRTALINQVKDGMEYFIGNYLDVVKRRGLAADRLQGIYQRNAAQMVRDGLDVAAIEAKIQRLKSLPSSLRKLAGISNDTNTWQTFVKDGVSSLIAQLTNSNQEIAGMMNDPQIQPYLTTDAPELNLLLDIAKISSDSRIFGKWVARKVPLIALIEMSTKTAYNGFDWILSFNRIIEANKINGKVLNAAKSIQRSIDTLSAAAEPCR